MITPFGSPPLARHKEYEPASGELTHADLWRNGNIPFPVPGSCSSSTASKIAAEVLAVELNASGTHGNPNHAPAQIGPDKDIPFRSVSFPGTFGERSQANESQAKPIPTNLPIPTNFFLSSNGLLPLTSSPISNPSWTNSWTKSRSQRQSRRQRSRQRSNYVPSSLVPRCRCMHIYPAPHADTRWCAHLPPLTMHC